MSDNKCNSYPWLRFGASFAFLFLFEKKKGNKTRERKPKNENILSTYNCYVLNASNPTRNMIGALVNAFRRSMIETYNLYRLYIIFFSLPFDPQAHTSQLLYIVERNFSKPICFQFLYEFFFVFLRLPKRYNTDKYFER